MSEHLMVPNFDNETDEANWWFDNQDKIAKAFDTASEAGTLRRTNLEDFKRRRASSTVVLDERDAALARKLAQESGETFEVYVKRVVHQALQLQKSA